MDHEARSQADVEPLDELLDIFLAALRMWPPSYIRGIFGPMRGWLPPRPPLAEFEILDPWCPKRTVDFLVEALIPAADHAPSNLVRTLVPRRITDLLWRPTRYIQQPDPFGSVTSYPDERWFFINGICTNEDVAMLNARKLSEMFGRPLCVIQNASNSLPWDLTQCVLGKTFWRIDPLDGPESSHRIPRHRDTVTWLEIMRASLHSVRRNQIGSLAIRPTDLTEPAERATEVIAHALVAPHVDKVVVIAHSEGTIIAANVIWALGDILDAADSGRSGHLLPAERRIMRTIAPGVRAQRGDDGEPSVRRYLRKLEVYAFANCATSMTYADAEAQMPFIESFANRKDFIARLGVLSPYASGPAPLIQIDGDLFVREDNRSYGSSLGHLLNQHYLFPIEAYLQNPNSPDHPDPYRPSERNSTVRRPRLYDYFR